MMRADADGHAPVEGAQRGLVAPDEPYGGGDWRGETAGSWS